MANNTKSVLVSAILNTQREEKPFNLTCTDLGVNSVLNENLMKKNYSSTGHLSLSNSKKNKAKPIKIRSFPSKLHPKFKMCCNTLERSYSIESQYKSRGGNAPDWTWKMQPSIACYKLKVIECDQTLTLAYTHRVEKRQQPNVEQRQAAQLGKSTANKTFDRVQIERKLTVAGPSFCNNSASFPTGVRKSSRATWIRDTVHYPLNRIQNDLPKLSPPKPL